MIPLGAVTFATIGKIIFTRGVIMSKNIIVTKTTTTVDVFYVPDTPENRQAVERGEYDKVIYDHDGYYQHLVDSYGEEEKITHRLPD